MEASLSSMHAKVLNIVDFDMEQLIEVTKK